MKTERADTRALNAILTMGIVVALVLGICIGTSDLPLNRVLAALVLQGDVGDRLVIWSIRLPRALAALVTGVGFGHRRGGTARPVAQSLGRTRRAGCFGQRIPVRHHRHLFRAGTSVGLGGAHCGDCRRFVGDGFLAFVALRVGSAVSLILVGVGLSSLAGAVMALAMNFAPNPFLALSDLVNWMGGSVANRSFEDLGLTCPFIALGCFVLMRIRQGLSALTLGEEAALGVGLDVKALRLWVVAGTGSWWADRSALRARIGFVGLICAHLVRPLVQHDPARTLLPAGLLGGLVLFGCRHFGAHGAKPE